MGDYKNHKEYPRLMELYKKYPYACEHIWDNLNWFDNTYLNEILELYLSALNNAHNFPKIKRIMLSILTAFDYQISEKIKVENEEFWLSYCLENFCQFKKFLDQEGLTMEFEFKDLCHLYLFLELAEYTDLLRPLSNYSFNCEEAHEVMSRDFVYKADLANYIVYHFIARKEVLSKIILDYLQNDIKRPDYFYNYQTSHKNNNKSNVIEFRKK